MADNYPVKIRAEVANDFTQSYYDERPTIGDHGELIVRDGDKMIVYSSDAWLSYSYPATAPHIRRV
jgi:hypothetical protein